LPKHGKMKKIQKRLVANDGKRARNPQHDSPSAPPFPSVSLLIILRLRDVIAKPRDFQQAAFSSRQNRAGERCRDWAMSFLLATTTGLFRSASRLRSLPGSTPHSLRTL
jgi:hypothetical protein